MTTLTPDQTHEQMWGAAISEFGNEHAVPAERANHISEVVRGLTILRGWTASGDAAKKELASYMVRDIAQDEVLKLMGLTATARKTDGVAPSGSRAARYRRLDDLAASNLFKEFTTDELMKSSGFSYPTILKYLTNSPAWRKAGRGRWEARNPVADRAYERNA
jgi:hypothetical protein